MSKSADYLTTLRRLNHKGLVVGQYIVEDLVREDARARHYAGRSLVGDRKVEVQVLKASYQDRHQSRGYVGNPLAHQMRVASEVGATLLLRHLDVGTTAAGEHYMIRERPSGFNGRQALSRVERLPLPEALAIVADAAAVVERLHELDYVHVDLRPENLLISMRGDGTLPEARLIDISTMVRVSSAAFHGLDEEWIEDPRYLAPEELGDKPLTPAVDIYGLGALLYELISGTAPVNLPGATHDKVVAYLKGNGKIPAERLRNVVRGLPDEVDMLVGKCLKRSTADRPGSVIQLMRGFHHCLRLFKQSNPDANVPRDLLNRLDR